MAIDLQRVLDEHSHRTNFETSSLNEGLEKNPDSYSKTVSLATDAGIPVSLIESDEKNVEADLRKQKATELYKLESTSPRLYEQMLRTEFAGQAHDDIPQLEALEKLFFHGERAIRPLENLTKTLPLGLDNTLSGIEAANLEFQNNLSFPFEKLPGELAMSDFASLRNTEGLSQGNFSFNDINLRFEEDNTERLQRSADLIEEIHQRNITIDELTPKDLNAFQEGLRGAIESLPLIASGMAFGGVTGLGTMGVLGVIGASSFGTSYSYGRTHGLSPNQSLSFAAFKTANEVITELIPIGSLVAMFKRNKTFTDNALQFLKQEVTTEQLATIGETLIDLVAGLDEELAKAPLGEKLIIQGRRQLVTFFAASMGGTLQVGGVTGVRKGYEKLLSEEQLQARKHAQDQAHIDNIKDNSEASKLKVRNKDEFRDYVDKVAPDEVVYIDGEQAFIYAQSKDKIEGDKVLEAINEQAEEANVTNGEVMIPVSTFAADVVGSEHYDALRPHMTMGDGALSPYRKANEAVDRQKYEQDIIAEANKHADLLVENTQIFDTVVQQLIDTGVVTPLNANRMAQIVPAWATVKSVETGIPVQELYDQVGLSIQGVGTPTGDVLGQELRGFYDPQNVMIRLNEATNATTFMHEFGHFMLDMEYKLPGDKLNGTNEWFDRISDDIVVEADQSIDTRIEKLLKEEVTEQRTIEIQQLQEFKANGGVTDSKFDPNGARDIKWHALNTARHEQFARGFEAYIMEGKAPSAKLRKMFREMTRIMVQVYKNIQSFSRPNIDDNMRQVFDRLIATEEEILAAELSGKYTPLFTDAVMAGMTEKQFLKYQQDQQEATDKATETVRDKLVKELRRYYTKQWKQERDEFQEEERERLSSEPVYDARATISTDSNYKLHRGDTLELLGLSKIPKNMKNMMTRDDELANHPDDIAPLFGYESGRDMVNDLLNAQSLENASMEAAESRMMAIHGDMLNDGTIEQEAEDAVQDDKRAKAMLFEIRKLSKGTRTPVIDRKTIQDIAVRQIGKLSFQEIKPERYRKAEQRSGILAHSEMQAGNKEAALKARTQQVMNFYLWKEAKLAKEATIKGLDYNATLDKKATRERIAKAQNGYWDSIQSIRGRFEFRKSKSLASHERERKSLKQWWTERNEDMDFISLSDLVLQEHKADTKHWREIPHDEFLGIIESLKSIQHNARTVRNIQIAGEKLTHEEAIVKGVDSIRKELPGFQDINHLRKLSISLNEQSKELTNEDKQVISRVADKLNIKVPKKISDKFVQKLDGKARKHDLQRTTTVDKGSFIKAHLAENTKIPWLMTWLDDGERVGTMYEMIMQVMTDSAHTEQMLTANVSRLIVEAMNTRSKETIKRHNKEFIIPEIMSDATEHVTANNGVLRGHQLLAVALNTGSQTNLRKLLMGEGWAVTEEEVSVDNPKLQAVLSELKQEDWDLVELIWKQINLLYPDLSNLHEKISGLPLKKVESVSFTLPDGRVIEGGYYPMHYDPARSAGARNRAESEAENQKIFSMMDGKGGLIPSVQTGSRIERTGYVAPVDLNLNIVAQHIQEVTHFISHFEAIKQVNKILNDDRMQAAIIAKVGVDEYNQLKPWLNRIAKNGRTGQIKSTMERTADRLRFGTTLGIMGYKASTTIVQVAGLFNTIAEVGFINLLQSEKKLGLAPIFSAIHNIHSSEKSLNEHQEYAVKVSKVLAHRMQTYDRDMKNAAQRIIENNSKFRKFQEMSMMPIAAMQFYVVDLPSWYAAYIKVMKEHKGVVKNSEDYAAVEAEAVKYADFVVEQIQGSGSIKDMSALMAGDNPYQKLVTMFMTFFSAAFNANRDVARQFKAGNITVADAAAKYTLMWMLPAIFEELVRHGLPDEDDDETFLERVLVGTALTPLAGNPMARVLSSGFQGYRTTISPVYALIERGIDGTHGVNVKAVTKFGAALVGVPGVNQAFLTLEHLSDVMVEGEELTIRELAYGPRR